MLLHVRTGVREVRINVLVQSSRLVSWNGLPDCIVLWLTFLMFCILTITTYIVVTIIIATTTVTAMVITTAGGACVPVQHVDSDIA